MASQEEFKELPITNVNTKLIQDLTNISKNLSVPRSAFLKMELAKIRDSYPQEMRVYKPDKKD